MRYLSGLVIWCALLSGCGLFAPKPDLPQPSLAAGDSGRDDEFVAAVREADLVYFAIDQSGRESEQTAWKLLEAFQRTGKPFAIGWQGIQADQQPILDRIAEGQGRPEREISSLKWDDSGPEPGARLILRAASGAPQLALGSPRSVETKLRRGGELTPAERVQVPRRYFSRADGLVNFTERLPAGHGLSDHEVKQLYRAFLFDEQFAAEKIVTHLQTHPDQKLLVFVRNSDLGEEGIPYFVAQKIKVRQIEFDRRPRGERPRLLTWWRARAGWVSRF